MKKYILFDLDGTLTDPKIGITTCVQYALKSFGIEENDLDKLEPFIGPPLSESFENFYGFSKEQAKDAVDKYRERFSTIGLYENEIYAGIEPMLKKLNKAGIRLAVASSKPTVFVEKILEHFHIRKYFQVVVGSELDGRRVNKDEVVDEALKQLFGSNSVEYDKVYMVGDRCFDVKGAKAVGVESIGVTYGYGGLEELKEAHADYIVQSVPELEELLLRETRTEEKNSVGSLLLSVLVPLFLFQIVKELVLLIFILFAGKLDKISSGNMATLASGMGALAAGVCIYGLTKKRIAQGFEERRFQYLYPIPLKKVICFVAATVLLALGINSLVTASSLYTVSETFQEVAARQWGASLWLGLICYGVLASAAEEMLFRGILYNRLRSSFEFIIAALLNAIIFGVYHGNIIQGVYAGIMGYLFCLAYEKFGSFIFPLGLHIIINCLVYLCGHINFLGNLLGHLLVGIVAVVLSVVLFIVEKKDFSL